MAMDVPRKDANRRKWIRRIVVVGVAAITIPAVTVGLSRLKPAAPVIEGGSYWPDEVKRGPMIVKVRGLGTLVAEQVLFIPANTDGRVERIYLKPGAAVTPDTILLTLVNDVLELDALDADYQVKGAEAKFQDTKVTLESATLTQQAEVARIESEYMRAKLQADRDEALFKQQLTAELTMKLSRATAEELVKRLEIEKERLKIRKDSVEAQLAVERANIAKLKAMHQLKKSQIEMLKVRAGAAGVLMEMPVQEGQRVPAGTILAKVSQPTKLKAELKVAETQAKDVILGQYAEVDTRNGIIKGRVIRIDPAPREGTVVVDVKLEGELPQGARPDLSVDGEIETDRLDDVVYVGRPAFGQPNSTVSMFKIDPDGKGASRVQVKLGKTSVNTIQVLDGLKVGERVILSDMSAWDSQDRLRIN
jgi:HlyD family secretion protein